MSLPQDDTTEVRVMDVTGPEYARSFELFLAGTDEKKWIHSRLDAIVGELPSRSVFVDVGAGSGATTAHVGRSFARTIAVEPSAAMLPALRRACPGAEILDRPVEEVELDAVADLALCSHMLYYLPRGVWGTTVRRILGWVRPGAELLVLLQHTDNACMRMLRHFTGVRFDLGPLAAELDEDRDGLVGDLTMETLPAVYRGTDPGEVLDVAEFMINVPSLAHQHPRPTRRELYDYVQREFALPGGGYRIEHAHDLLRLRRA